jgi:hypothetical protein
MSAYAQFGGQPNTAAMLIEPRQSSTQTAKHENVRTSLPDAVSWARTPSRLHREAGKLPQRFLASTPVVAFSLWELAGRFLPCD